MTRKFKIIISIVSVIFLLIVCFLFLYMFWLRYFFIDEFATINVTYTGTAVLIVNPVDTQKIDPATSIVGSWKNASDKTCDVRISAADFKQEFFLAPGETFGTIFSKRGAVSFTFCDQEGKFYLSPERNPLFIMPAESE